MDIKHLDLIGKTIFKDVKALYNTKLTQVYVVDSADTERMEEAKEELKEMLEEEELEGVPLLVLANKQDLSLACSAQEIAEKMELERIRNRKWSIFACSVVTNENIQEGLEWLIKSM